MKHWILLLSVAVLAGCNNDNQKTDDHSSHGDHGDATGTNTTAIRELHDAMTRMMTDLRNSQASGDPDKDFAIMMKVHHLAAVKMAKTELRAGTDSTMRSLAERIIADQDREIAVFDVFINAHKNLRGKSKLGQRFLDMMKTHDMGAAGSTVDGSFANMMIPHHEDGINMAKEYLKEAKDPKLKEIANNIVRSQEKEIEEMRTWLATWQEPAVNE
jgi:uncharacterized protein (DUF305 family)